MFLKALINILPADTTGLLHVVGASLDDLCDAPPELGLALGVAGQALDVLVILEMSH